MDLNNIKNINVSCCQYFKQHYEEILHNYKRYGECVLDVDLGDTEDEIREIFINSENAWEFSEKITKFWKDRYQVIVKNPSDIPRMIELGKTAAEEITDDNSDSLVLVSKEFFKKLKEKASENQLVVVLNDDVLYIIKLEHTTLQKYGIRIQNIIPINQIIK